MNQSSAAATGPVLPAKKQATSTAAVRTEAFDALGTVVTEVASYLRIRAVERARREQISAYRELELEKLHIVERTLDKYFQESFKERAASLTQLFEHLDTAIASGDDATARTVLGGIVDIAKTSPLASAGDFSQIRAALDDPGHVWTF